MTWVPDCSPELLSYLNVGLEEQGALWVGGVGGALLPTISGLPCHLCEASRHRLDHYE